MKKNTLFIATSFNIEITSSLGKGIELKDGIYITNDKRFISSLIDDYLHVAIGNLEFDAIQESKALFYKVSIEDIKGDNYDDLLADFLSVCKLFSLDLWTEKDHAMDIILGYMYYPYLISKIIDTRNIPEVIHSNTLSGRNSLADGCYKMVSFGKGEIEKVISNSIKTVPYSESSKKKTFITNEYGRFAVATMFIQTARQSYDLGQKIAYFCSCFETLFTTDAQEISHKLAERIAWFIEPSDFELRLKLYKDVKILYGIRSQVVHGGSIGSKTFNSLAEHSIQADSVARRIIKKLLHDKELLTFIALTNSDKLETYFSEMCLGKAAPALLSSPQSTILSLRQHQTAAVRR